MNNDNFLDSPQSYWIDSVKKTNYPKLEQDITVDVAIIGGGIVGITTAYMLKQAGLKVTIVEASHILKGTTGHTTAKVTSQHSLIYDTIKTKMGQEKAQQYADANEWAIKYIKDLVNEKNIHCDFIKKPAYLYTQSDKYVQNIQKEVEAASSLGIPASYLDKIPLDISIKAAMRFDNQAQFHPLKYLHTLVDYIQSDENCIFEQTKALDIEQGDTCTVHTDTKNKVFAKSVVVASHYPFYDGMGMYFSRIYPYRSYALGIKAKEKLPDGMFINAEEPSRSLRSQPYEDGELIIVAGENHKTGQSPDTNLHYKNLIEYAKQNFQVQDILYRWSTQDYETMDMVPYVGSITSDKPNIYIATGFNKWGMTNSTASANIIKELIINGNSPWADVYNPSRFTPKASAKTFIIENANVAKELVTGKLKTVPENLDINIGEGKEIEIDGRKVGVYKDENSVLHYVTTTCTHLGCTLQWNTAELSWDCPCHGSRFTYEGINMECPALKSIKIEIE